AELAGLGVVVAAAWLLMPTTMSTWFQRTWLLADIPWPQATYITPIGFDAQGVMPYPRGDELVIVALNEGELPKKVTLHWSAPDGRSGEQPMARVGEVNWQASLGVLTESLSFTIRGGDESTREYTVRAVDRPQVVETVIRVSPPAYTGL